MNILTLINDELEILAALGDTSEDQKFVDYLNELSSSLPLSDDDL